LSSGSRERGHEQQDRRHQTTVEGLEDAQGSPVASRERVGGKPPARGEARARLIEEAHHLFLARSFADVSMQEIADTVGVTKAAMYYHFQSKEDLFEEVARQSINGFWEGIIAHSRSTGPLREVLLDIVTFVKASLESVSLRLIDDVKHHCSPEAQHRLLAEHPTPERELQDLFRRAIAAGEMRPLDVEPVSELFLAMLFSLSHRGPGARQPQPGHDALLIDVLLHGIAATPQQEGASAPA
jgi:AcrR family transcriptional regulator